MYFSSDVVNGQAMKKGPTMVIKQVYLGTGVIDVSGDDNFGLAPESNINVSNKFYAAVAGGIKTTHRIMRVGTFVYKKTLAINHGMIQER